MDHVFRAHYTVRSLEMDARGRLSVVALLGMLQEAAGGSAESLGFSVPRLLQDGVSWVLARFRLTMSEWPAWRNELQVLTWPSGADVARAYREFRVLDGTGREIGSATSVWMVIDLATRRPVRIPRFVLEMGVPDTTGQRPAALAPLVRSKVEEHALEFRVRWSDLDLNDHANNVCYVEWALETVPPELRASAFPSRLAIDYRAEARLGDIVRATRTGIAPGVFSHRVAHAADGRDMAIVETTWAT